ncbi:reverse transcriptase [Gossypium australe]|uniref:Reverse transcriptase n=1 Tax=Gossypium australe TaxID=47621 RepID=A0A5B6VPG1_9ROSI|nr:reverse transcriptase [Gossypium australe]
MLHLGKETRESVEDLQEDPREANKELELEKLPESVPFPSRLEERQKWDEDEFVSFLNLFKTLNVNLPLIELIEKVPKYAKFLKEIMSGRRKIKAGEQVNMSASCSAIISRQVPRKLKDLGSTKHRKHSLE